MISQVPNNVTAKSSPSYPAWVTDELLRDYYDTEWGVPVTDERGLFEALSLEAFQVVSPGARFLRDVRHSDELLRGSIPSVWLPLTSKMLRDCSRMRASSVTNARFGR